MDFRQYDNAIGRFNTIDALAEFDNDKSPYAFARNSPAAFNDPTGLCPECEDYYEQQGYEPSGGQTYMSSGGAEYTFNEIAGQWDRTDLMNTLDEVVITASGFDGTHGSNDDRAGVDQRDDILDSWNDVNNVNDQIILPVTGIIEIGARLPGSTISSAAAFNRKALSATVEAAAADAKLIKIAGNISRVANVLGVGYALTNVALNQSNSNYAKLGAQVAIIGIEAGVNLLVPGLGFVVGFGLSALESSDYVQGLYNKLDK